MDKDRNPAQMYEGMRKELVPCGLCGSGDFLPFLNRDRHGMGIATVMCRSCGFVFINPRPLIAEMKKFKQSTFGIFYSKRSDPLPAYQKNHSESRQAKWLYQFVGRELSRTSPAPFSVFDARCGSGALLYRFHQNRADNRLYGAELDPVLARYAAIKAKAVIDPRDLESFLMENTLPKQTLHLIVLNRVLECLNAPFDALVALRDLLLPQGLLLIDTPNLFSPYRDWQTGQFHLTSPGYFSPQTLEAALSVSGFEPVKKFTAKHPVDPWAMTYLVRRAGVVRDKKDVSLISAEEFQCLWNSMDHIRRKVDREAAADTRNLLGKFTARLQGQRPWPTLFETARYVAGTISRRLSSSVLAGKAAALKRHALQLLRDVFGFFCYLGYAKELRRLIKGRAVLIVGSGFSAGDLEEVPSGTLIFTCNAGLKIFAEKNLRTQVDLFLCEQDLLACNYKQVAEFMGRIKTKVFLTDDPGYVRRREDFDGFYQFLFRDTGRYNYSLGQLIRPYKVRQIRGSSRAGQTSQGVRLLQYALWFEARQVYVIGLDFGLKEYFWGESIEPSAWRHHDMDENFIRIITQKYSNVYSLSKKSPILKYIPYKSF